MKAIKIGAGIIGASLGLIIGGIGMLIMANALMYASYMH